MARISIIIPVYNAEKRLYKCLDSVITQSVTDFECILVNDGSTDNSLNICKQYEERDNRFKVVSIKNGGPGSARNEGIRHANSRWITFIDADDYVDASYLENFLKYNENDDEVQVIQGYHCMGYQGENDDTIYPGTTYSFLSMVIGENRDYIEKNNILQDCGVWCKIFSTKIIKQHNLLFDERLFCSQDGIFWHHYLCFIRKLIFIQERGYYYFCPRKYDSVSRNGKHKNTFEDWYARADNYREISAVLPTKMRLSLKGKNFIYSQYFDNYFRALLKQEKMTKDQQDSLKKLKPSVCQIIFTPRGVAYWILNFFPIEIVRMIRKFFLNAPRIF